MSDLPRCNGCGDSIGLDAPAGLCPVCMLRAGLDEETRLIGPEEGDEPWTTFASGSGEDRKGYETHSVPGVEEMPGRYTRKSEYARGGMGKILLVHDAHLNRDVALKEIIPHSSASSDQPSPLRMSVPHVARFLQEAQITGQLEHPSIVPVYELGHRTDGTLYYTMKLVRGRTLSEAVQDATTLKERLALLPRFIDLCQAIAYAHSRGVIHRDIKPTNVMVGEFGETVVIDWGLAKAIKPDDVYAEGLEHTIRPDIASTRKAQSTVDGQIFGTPAYMSPEQAAGDFAQVDELSDIYSLGCVLYEILTGRPPYMGAKAVNIIQFVRENTPEPIRSLVPGVPGELVAICERAMNFERSSRPNSAKTLANETQSYLQGEVVESYRYSPLEVAKRFLARHRPYFMAASLGTILIVICTPFLVAYLLNKNLQLQTAIERSNEETYFANVLLASNYIQNDEFDLAEQLLLSTRDEHREWEWHYLYAKCGNPLLSIGGDTHSIRGARFGQLGEYIITWNGEVKIWDATTEKNASFFEYQSSGASLCGFSPGGDLIYISEHGRVAIWNRDPPNLVYDIELSGAVAKDVRFSPNEQLVASLDNNGKILCTELDSTGTTQPISRTLNGKHTAFELLSNRVIIALSESGDLEVYDLDSSILEPFRPLAGSKVRSFALHRDGDQFAVLETDGTIVLRKMSNLDDQVIIGRAIADTSKLSFSGDNRWLLATKAEDGVSLYKSSDPYTHLPIRVHTGSVSKASFSPDSKYLVLEVEERRGVKRGIVWSIESQSPISSLQPGRSSPQKVEYAPDGSSVLTISNGICEVWGQQPKPIVWTSDLAGPTGGGSAARGNIVIGTTKQSRMAAWEVTSGDILREFGVAKADVSCTALAQNCELAAFGMGDGALSVFNLTSGEGFVHPGVDDLGLSHIAFGFSGNSIITASIDGRLTLLDISNMHKTKVQNLPTPKSQVTALGTGMGNRIGIGSRDDGILVLNEHGQFIAELKSHDSPVTAIAFSADSELIACGYFENAISVFELSTGREILWLKGHRDSITQLAFSASGSRLLSSSSDGTARLWELSDGKCLSVLEGPEPNISKAWFAPDGENIFTIHNDGWMMSWGGGGL